jgi:hypothetical protein
MRCAAVLAMIAVAGARISFCTARREILHLSVLGTPRRGHHCQQQAPRSRLGVGSLSCHSCVHSHARYTPKKTRRPHVRRQTRRRSPLWLLSALRSVHASCGWWSRSGGVFRVPRSCGAVVTSNERRTRAPSQSLIDEYRGTSPGKMMVSPSLIDHLKVACGCMCCGSA